MAVLYSRVWTIRCRRNEHCCATLGARRPERGFLEDQAIVKSADVVVVGAVLVKERERSIHIEGAPNYVDLCAVCREVLTIVAAADVVRHHGFAQDLTITHGDVGGSWPTSVYDLWTKLGLLRGRAGDVRMRNDRGDVPAAIDELIEDVRSLLALVRARGYPTRH